MQRLFNVTKWRRLVDGQSIRLGIERPRMVRLEVNAPQATGLYLFEAETGEAVFLARVEGRDTIEFYSGGSFSLVSDGECFIYTADGETVHHVAVDPVIFTRITERRQMNPEIAAIQQRMQINIERRLAAQRDEFNAAIRAMQADRVLAARAARQPAAKPEGEGVSDGDPAPSESEGGTAGGVAPADPPKQRKGK